MRSMDYLELISVPAIAAIVFALMSAVKYAVNNTKFDRFVPLLSALLGAAFGVVCFYALPEIIPAKNVVVAAVLGGASGLTATGTHQMVKQLGEKPDASQTKSEKQTENTENTTEKTQDEQLNK